MAHRIATLLCCVVATGTSTAQDHVALPRDIPPVIGMATAKALPDVTVDGRYQITLVVPSIAYEIVSRERRLGKLAVWDEVVAEVQSATRIIQLESASQIPDSRFVDIAGQQLSGDTILRRLAKQTPVLVSVSGRMVDPYYLQLLRKDTIIVLLSRKDGQGDRALLPRHTQGLSKTNE